jgi:hypothetical protein
MNTYILAHTRAEINSDAAHISNCRLGRNATVA